MSRVSARDAKAWESIVRKLRSGLMPPAGMPRPDRATHDAFVRRIEGALDAAAAARPNPGRTEPLHRLNRTEYRNAVRDLLGLDVNVASLLPPDDVSYGFDNVAGVLKMSPTLMERYLAAAQKVSRLAIGTPPPAPVVDYFRLSDDLRQDAHLEAQPLGTRGGTTIRHIFPLDGEYVIKPRLARDLNESVPLYLEPQTLEVSLDGERIELLTVPGAVPAPARGRGAGGPAAPPAAPPAAQEPTSSEPGQDAPAGPRPRPAITQIDAGIRVSPADREKRNHVDDAWDVRVRVTAGQRDVTLAFLRKTAALDETIRLPFARPYPAGVNIAETRMGLHLRSVEIVGPYNPAGADASPSRRADLLVHAAARLGRGRVCAFDPRVPGPARLSPSGGRRRRRAAAGDVPRGPRARAGLRRRHRAGGSAAAGQPRVPVSRRARPGAGAGRACIASAIWSWPRASRSSCGAASPTRRCWIWRPGAS